jgi:hypothetical protein
MIGTRLCEPFADQPKLADTESATKAAFYQVKVDGVVQTGHWNVYFWTGVTNVLQTISPATVGGTPGCFPVHS